MKRKDIPRAIVEALIKHKKGLSIHDLCDILQSDYEAVRAVLKNKRPLGVYIDSWVRVSKGPYTAIYKMVKMPKIPEDADQPKVEAGEPIIFRERIKPTKAEVRISSLPAQGMTQIRGPWPTEVRL